MSDKTIVITGATSGIGKATVQALSSKRFRIIILARNITSGQALAKSLGNAQAVCMELSSPDSVLEASELIAKEFSQIDALVNNAGVFGYQQREETPEGFEKTIATNYLGHWLLATKLKPLIKPGGQIINLTSSTHRSSKLNREDFFVHDNYHPFRVYGRSKLMMMLFSVHAAREWQDLGIHAVDPGTVATGIDRTWGSWARLVYKVGKPFMQTPEKGASTSIKLLTEEGPFRSGGLYKDRKEVKPAPQGADTQSAAWLWEHTEKLLRTWL